MSELSENKNGSAISVSADGDKSHQNLREKFCNFENFPAHFPDD